MHPPRHVPLQGASNFRDLGGYVGHGGRRVRWRLLFRSDHLAHLSASDRAQLEALKIGRSFDFRGLRESADQSYDWPGTTRHSLAIEPTLVQYLYAQLGAGRPISVQDAVQAMQTTYEGFVRNNSDRFAELFTHLLAQDAPLVFHCTAGKDRTGLAAALVLSALGVSQEDILQDYLLTNTVYRYDGALSATGASLSPEIMAVVWRVREEFLQVSLRVIQDDYGSMQTYLQQRIGLTPPKLERLRQMYLA